MTNQALLIALIVVMVIVVIVVVIAATTSNNRPSGPQVIIVAVPKGAVVVAISGSLPLVGGAVVGPQFVVSDTAAANGAFVQWVYFGASDCAIVEGLVMGTGWRKLLRFNTAISNVGDRPFYLGDPAKHPNVCHWSNCHHHYHLQGFAEYSLLDANDNVLLRARKQGFCLEDTRPGQPSLYGVPTPSQPVYDCANQGLSVGWADVYDLSLDGQWIDITNIPAGTYTLRIAADPDNMYNQTKATGSTVDIQVKLPDVPQPTS